MIGIVVALEKEAIAVLPLIKNKNEKLLAGKKVIEGKLFGKDIALIFSGIGKVSAALSTQALIDNYNLEYVFNFGSVGAVNQKIKVNQFYLVDKCMQFDFDVREIDDVPLGYIQDYDRVFFETSPIDAKLERATLGTSDKFTSKSEIIEEIIDCGIDIRDMEGSAIAQTCISNDVKLIILKGVTDIYGSGNDGEQFIKNLIAVSNNFPTAIEEIFKSL
ncbi:MAG: 5'-methylthioadenosine/S-adenosylhomocysteine nucleosidase [Clostridia bacterium]|nr:5'-methylthioadenosine/S-adenosylhomocysteine nucleosidase [Clostridia bacterium]